MIFIHIMLISPSLCERHVTVSIYKQPSFCHLIIISDTTKILRLARQINHSCLRHTKPARRLFFPISVVVVVVAIIVSALLRIAELWLGIWFFLRALMRQSSLCCQCYNFYVMWHVRFKSQWKTAQLIKPKMQNNQRLFFDSSFIFRHFNHLKSSTLMRHTYDDKLSLSTTALSCSSLGPTAVQVCVLFTVWSPIRAIAWSSALHAALSRIDRPVWLLN